MSWEASNSEPHPCPCGKGHYTVTYLSDDWGRSDERWSMQCVRCNANYSLYMSEGKDPKGIRERSYAWVPEKALQEINRSNQQVVREVVRLAEYLEDRYGERWRAHFADKRKKAIWQELTQDGAMYPSLSAFYALARSMGLPQVLNQHLGYQDAQTVVRVLKLRDDKLLSKIANVRKLEQAAAAKERKMKKFA